MQPHKHAEVIKAWADGVPVQFLSRDRRWIDLPSGEAPIFAGETYRIKPHTRDEQTDDCTGICEVSE